MGMQVWSSYSVLNVLYSLIQKSKIDEYITAQQEGKSQDEIKCVVSRSSVVPTDHTQRNRWRIRCQAPLPNARLL
jgi:hypothetical protein